MASAAQRKRRTARKQQPTALADHEPLQHQRAHGVEPVEAVTVKVRTSVGKVNGVIAYVDEEVVRTVRRQADARIWEHIDTDADRERAAYQMFGAWRRVTMGTGMRTFDPTRVSGGGDVAASVEHNADLSRTYDMWKAVCQDRGVDWFVARDMLCHGVSARVIEQTARRRNGWAIEEMLRALDQWCFIKHWKQEGGAS
jgi:hypothetical protein